MVNLTHIKGYSKLVNEALYLCFDIEDKEFVLAYYRDGDPPYWELKEDRTAIGMMDLAPLFQCEYKEDEIGPDQTEGQEGSGS